MTTHNVTKKEIKHDGFVEGTEKGLEFLQKHGMTIGIAAVAIIGGGTSREQGISKADNRRHSGDGG